MRQRWCRCQCRYGCRSNVRRVVWICRVVRACQSIHSYDTDWDGVDISRGWVSVLPVSVFWVLWALFYAPSLLYWAERCPCKIPMSCWGMSVFANCMFIRIWTTVDEYEFVVKERDTHSCMRGGRNSLAVGRVTVPVLGQRERLWGMLSCLRRVNQLIVLGYECCRDLSHCRQIRMRHSTSVCLVLTVQQREGNWIVVEWKWPLSVGYSSKWIHKIVWSQYNQGMYSWLLKFIISCCQ